jgi:transcriptional regulator with XRE-family HTH domain
VAGIYELLSGAMRERFGGSVTRLAEACEVSVALTSRWVHEDEKKRIVPGPASCEKIASGLDLDADYVLEAAGHRKPRPDRAQQDPVQSELDTRLARLGATLRKYPRAVWVSVMEANDRMAEALAHSADPPVSAPEKGGVSASIAKQNRGKQRDHDPFTLRKRLAQPLLA